MAPECASEVRDGRIHRDDEIELAHRGRGRCPVRQLGAEILDGVGVHVSELPRGRADLETVEGDARHLQHGGPVREPRRAYGIVGVLRTSAQTNPTRRSPRSGRKVPRAIR